MFNKVRVKFGGMGGDHGVVLLTGGTSGIGRAAARQLAERGATVLVTGRRRRKGEAVLDEIRAAHPDGAGEFYPVDFADLGGVRQLAADVKADYDRLDVLVNNAGTGEPERTLTEDGIEKTFAVNYVAPFLLTNLLVPRLCDSPPARVLNTVTVARHDSLADMRGAVLSNLEVVATGDYNFNPEETPGADTPFDPTRAYVNSKLALLLFTYELAARLAGTGVTVACFHPGLIGATDFPRHMPLRLKMFYRTAALTARITPLAGILFGTDIVDELETQESAGETLVHLALDQELVDGEGAYFDQRDRTAPGPWPHDEALRTRLWKYTATLTGLTETIPV